MGNNCIKWIFLSSSKLKSTNRSSVKKTEIHQDQDVFISVSSAKWWNLTLLCIKKHYTRCEKQWHLTYPQCTCKYYQIKHFKRNRHYIYWDLARRCSCIGQSLYTEDNLSFVQTLIHMESMHQFFSYCFHFHSIHGFKVTLKSLWSVWSYSVKIPHQQTAQMSFTWKQSTGSNSAFHNLFHAELQ